MEKGQNINFFFISRLKDSHSGLGVNVPQLRRGACAHSPDGSGQVAPSFVGGTEIFMIACTSCLP